MNDIKTTLKIFIQLQSLVHSIDDLSESVLFKRELKQKSNNYLKTIETKLNLIGRSMDKEEQQYFNSIVSELDKLVDTIKIEL
tara:strand:+ start:1007 stop:1255 length:249 start_codon:yes stop_codon:yes gene_type:complete